MKTFVTITAAVLGMAALAAVDSASAAGHGRGYGMQSQAQSQTQTQSQTANQARHRYQAQTQSQSDSAVQTRPADSQRRDGTFLTTGTTANGSTVRPGNGNGLQDGSRLSTDSTVSQ